MLPCRIPDWIENVSYFEISMNAVLGQCDLLTRYAIAKKS